MIPAADIQEGELLHLAYALESKSEHPLARAILQKAEEKQMTAADVTDFQGIAGQWIKSQAGWRRSGWRKLKVCQWADEYFG